MEQMALAELINSELNAAVFNKDKEAIRRFSILISEKIAKKEEIEQEQDEAKSDIRTLIEIVKEGFEHINQRFEDVNRRFEDINRRFEDINKRFEDMQKYMDKRFEDINKRFDMMFKFMSLGFSMITLLIVVFKFIH